MIFLFMYFCGKIRTKGILNKYKRIYQSCFIVEIPLHRIYKPIYALFLVFMNYDYNRHKKE